MILKFPAVWPTLTGPTLTVVQQTPLTYCSRNPHKLCPGKTDRDPSRCAGEYNVSRHPNLHQTSFFSSVVERGIAANARHPKVPVSITGGS
jgi:hypothetical protein